MSDANISHVKGGQIDIIRETISRATPDISGNLPDTMPVDRFVRSFMTSIKNSRHLMAAFQTPKGRAGAISAALQSSHDGLYLDGREAALVPYKDNIQYIPMTYGLMKIARNSGEVSLIDEPKIIYEFDEFEYSTGLETVLRHRPNLFEERGRIFGAYAVAKLKSGESIHIVLTKKEIDKIRAVSRAQNGPWGSWYEEMAKKTAFRRLAKYLPRSTDNLSVIDVMDRDPSMQVDFSMKRASTAEPVLLERTEDETETPKEEED